MRHHRMAVATTRWFVLGAMLAIAPRGFGQVRGPEFQEMVRGDSLAGWVQRGGKANFRVEEGVIIGQSSLGSPSSFLCTKRMYGDFVFECEFKVDAGLIAGVQIRSQSVPGYREGAVHGYRVAIDPSDPARMGAICDENRRGWLATIENNADARQAFRPGEWNHLRIRAVGPSIRTNLNNVPMVDVTDRLSLIGFIALEVQSTDVKAPLEVRWRNLRLQDLGMPWRQAPADGVYLLHPKLGLRTWHQEKTGGQVTWVKHPGNVIEILPGSGNIVTRQGFGDGHYHLEFQVSDNGREGQANGNSGVYLQGRYEVQILNSAGQPPADNLCGAIYGIKAPDYNMAYAAGKWQLLDIDFVAARWDADGKKISSARMTVYHNGTLIHDNVEVPHATTAGQPEAPGDGPLLLQDHGNEVKFRNIWYAPTHTSSD
jgi:hypothetical protein